jgi:hyperosmotically inducible protein
MNKKVTDQIVFSAVLAAMLVAGTPLFALESDAAIDSTYKQTYVYRTYLKDDSISADAKDGVVTLTGTVADGYNRALAQDTAECLPGVVRVENKLATKAEVDAKNADMWMGRKVKLALMFHRNVSVANTIVKVKGGVVTLTGEASSMAQKELTTQYAGDIDGVTEVRNAMTVAAMETPADRTMSEKLDDASVTALVKSALLTHRSTSAVNTKVVTRDGVVMLTGIANNAAEKSLVTKLVGDIHGVTSVENQMTIKDIVTN